MPLLPPSADLLADYADALAMAQGRTLAGAPAKLIEKALVVDPNHLKSRALSGSAAYEIGDYAKAVREWKFILTMIPPDAEMVAGINASIADAQSKLGSGAVPESITPPKKAAAASGVSGTVKVAPELLSKLPANATLFVFARPVAGTRMPLALVSAGSTTFPQRFGLDDSHSITPTNMLSSAESVVLGARISLSGSPMGQTGDFEGYSAPVKMGSKDVVITINEIKK